MNAIKSLIDRFQPANNPAGVGPIGVQFAREALHLVQMQGTAEGGVAVRARASIPYPAPRETLMGDPKSLKPLVNRALRTNGFSGRKAVSSMPAVEVRIISVAYQLEAGLTDDDAIVKLMRDRVDGDLADYVVDYVPVRTPSKDRERLALVAVSAREAVLTYLELLRQLGLAVEALEIGPVAIKRLVTAMSPAGPAENVLVINFGDRKSYLTMISHRRLLSDREIAFGEQTVLQRLSQTLDMSPEMARDLVFKQGLDPQPGGDPVSTALEATGMFNILLEIVKPELARLVDEMKRAFMYASSESQGKSVKRVYIVGSIARWPGSDRLLSVLTELPVSKIPDPTALFQTESIKRQDQGSGSTSESDAQPELAVATGLALRGMTRDARD